MAKSVKELLDQLRTQSDRDTEARLAALMEPYTATEDGAA